MHWDDAAKIGLTPWDSAVVQIFLFSGFVLVVPCGPSIFFCTCFFCFGCLEDLGAQHGKDLAVKKWKSYARHYIVRKKQKNKP